MSLFKSKTFWIFFALVLGLGQWFRLEHNAVNSSKITSWTVNHKGDCAIVLTGGPGRVREGFNLLTQGRIRKLIISGVNPNSELREIFPEWPFYGAINPEDVILERRSATTYGNGQQTLPLVEALSCRDVVLITSRLHMYRSIRLFTGIFPPEIQVKDRAIPSGLSNEGKLDHGLEVLKSMFYSLWAY